MRNLLRNLSRYDSDAKNFKQKFEKNNCITDLPIHARTKTTT